RPPQPISNQYPCSLALFVFKNQARGQGPIRISVRLKFLLSLLIQSFFSRYFGRSPAIFGSKFVIEDSARRYLGCLEELPSCSK
ncbi:unnamed protein product, partial [Hymenolepis diminuta]